MLYWINYYYKNWEKQSYNCIKNYTLVADKMFLQKKEWIYSVTIRDSKSRDCCKKIENMPKFGLGLQLQW